LGGRAPDQPPEDGPVDAYFRPEPDPSALVVVEVRAAPGIAPEPVRDPRDRGVPNTRRRSARPDGPTEHGRMDPLRMRRQEDQQLGTDRPAALVHGPRCVDLDGPQHPDVDRRLLFAVPRT